MRDHGVVLSCAGLAKSFGDTVALDEFELELHEGVILALLGPSGCGKTTALRVIAGFETPSRGEVRVAGRLVAGRGSWVPPERRRIGMVFQDWALFPHLDVWHNVSFGLGRDELERVTEVLSLVRLEGLGDRMPHELSGGQQQRVAIARALAPRPEVVLLDEPFSNLDASLRARVRAEVKEVLREAKATAIFVTHDQEEALSMADELAVMAGGGILQMGTPHQVYGAPESRAVAELVGEANWLPGVAGGGHAHTALGDVPAAGVPDGPVELMVRPEAIELRPDPDGAGRIVDAEFYGHDQLVRAQLVDGTMLTVRVLGPRPDLTADARVTAAVRGPVRCFSLEESSG